MQNGGWQKRENLRSSHRRSKSNRSKPFQPCFKYTRIDGRSDGQPGVLGRDDIRQFHQEVAAQLINS